MGRWCWSRERSVRSGGRRPSARPRPSSMRSASRSSDASSSRSPTTHRSTRGRSRSAPSSGPRSGISAASSASAANAPSMDADRMPGARWFPDARLNFAENLLRRRDGTPALDRARRARRAAHAHLGGAARRGVARRAGAARAGRAPRRSRRGLSAERLEAIVAMLAAASLGAIWSSCSPDFGVQGVVDRFGQIEPRVLFACDGYAYGGKTPRRARARRRGARAAAVGAALRRRGRISQRGRRSPDCATRRAWNEFTGRFAPGEIAFERLPFDHPLYILYSSGTTGVPKCIVHGAGGTLLQHLKEQRLHTDLRAGDRFFYFTTTGWMMWNWLASGLASEATLVLFDGSPFHPGPAALFDLAAEEHVDVFGISAKFLDSLRKAGHCVRSRRTTSRACARSSPPARRWRPRASTSSTTRSRRDVQLASISGGTDIVSCFVLRRSRPAGVARRDPAPGPRHGGRRVRRRGPAGARRRGRAGLHQAVPVDAGRLLERRRRRALPRGVLRALPRRLAPRRLRRVDAARRHDHPRPQRRDAEPGRRAHRHRRDLPPGGAARRSRRGDRDRPGVAGRRARRAVRAAARRARARRRAARPDQAAASATTPRRATCPR